jgi:hypothetical protein
MLVCQGVDNVFWYTPRPYRALKQCTVGQLGLGWGWPWRAPDGVDLDWSLEAGKCVHRFAVASTRPGPRGRAGPRDWQAPRPCPSLRARTRAWRAALAGALATRNSYPSQQVQPCLPGRPGDRPDTKRPGPGHGGTEAGAPGEGGGRRRRELGPGFGSISGPQRDP